MTQLDLFGGNLPVDRTYRLGKTKEANDLWDTTGLFGLPNITEMLGFGGSSYRVQAALELSAALICLDVLAQDISKAKLRLKRRETGRRAGVFEVLPEEHPIARMLALEPNEEWHTWPEFVQMLIYHLGLQSNTYAYVRRSNNGDILELIPLQPSQVEELVNPNGPKGSRLFYDISASSEYERAQLGFSSRRCSSDEVLHIRQRVLDGFWGYSTLRAGAATLNAARVVENYQNELFKENGLFRGYFQRGADKPITGQEQFDRIRSQLKKAFVPRRPNDDVPLMEDGIEYKEMGMNAKEAELPKALETQVERIAQLWRMPPHKIMHLGAVKYENLSTLEMIYKSDTLIPMCQLVEARMAKTLLTEDERLTYFFEFDRDAMSIDDEKERNTRLKNLAERGIISINEARAEDGYNPRKGGDRYIIPGNSMIVDEDGNIITSISKPGDNNADSKTNEPSDGNPDDGKSATVTPLRVVPQTA